jgi:hypothetical protein
MSGFIYIDLRTIAVTARKSILPLPIFGSSSNMMNVDGTAIRGSLRDRSFFNL